MSTPMAKNSEYQNQLVQGYEDAGYESWPDTICASVAAESDCCYCGFVGLNFRGFQSHGVRVAIAICPKCGHQEEF